VIHSYLVHPGKHIDPQPAIRGTEVPQAGKLFGMLQKVFFDAEKECHHAIAFTPEAAGAQKNECLNEVVEYVKVGTLPVGRKLAERLQKATTNISGLGLLFLMIGHDKGVKKVVISRFRAEHGILAEESERSLTVEFIEKVFMKNAASYKAATFSGSAPSTDFWKGRAIDKQINNPETAISSYWIRSFLLSDFLTPGEAGTRRFAMALREAINRESDPAAKDELVAACKLLRGFNGKVKSARNILEDLNISEHGKNAVKKNLSKARLFDDPFQFIRTESEKLLAFRTVELDNGGLLTAPAERFDEVFESHAVKQKANVYRFSTEGKIVDQRLKKAKQ
jgi:hypothetical protein